MSDDLGAQHRRLVKRIQGSPSVPLVFGEHHVILQDVVQAMENEDDDIAEEVMAVIFAANNLSEALCGELLQASEEEIEEKIQLLDQMKKESRMDSPEGN